MLTRGKERREVWSSLCSTDPNLLFVESRSSKDLLLVTHFLESIGLFTIRSHSEARNFNTSTPYYYLRWDPSLYLSPEAICLNKVWGRGGTALSIYKPPKKARNRRRF